jgi:Ser/Thr protein kinase RdoA (MazF antagonist)
MGFTALSRQVQVARLRGLAREALVAYGLGEAPLRLLQHEHNTTFRVGRDHVLRIGRAQGQTLAALTSEAAWLRALAADTGLVVPAPVATRDGALAVTATVPGVPGPRGCVLLRWVGGRFLDRTLAPVHARRMARTLAALHAHALRWRPPPGFTRPPVGRLTARAPDGAAADEDEAVRLVAEHVAARDAETVRAALHSIRTTERDLAGTRDQVALVHGDLHHENVVFAGGQARPIDFDDCGRGPLLYDLAVPRFEFTGRPALRDALLDEYASLRGLPRRAEDHLATLELLRRLQMVMWVLESREHPHFRARWRAWARADLDDLAAAVS